MLHDVEVGLNGETAGVKSDGFLVAETYVGGEDGQELTALIAVDDEDNLHFKTGFSRDAYRACDVSAFHLTALHQLQKRGQSMGRLFADEVALVKLFDHTHHVKVHLSDAEEKRFGREPRVHQDMVCLNTLVQSAFQQGEPFPASA